MLSGNEVLSLIGSKFYAYDEENNLIQLRVVGMNNSESVKVRYIDGSEEKINPNSLVGEGSPYKQLKPDGIIMFNVVDVADGMGGSMPDVIVTLHRKNDLDNGNSVPYCVCRQNVNDIFYEYMNPNPAVIYAGCCVSIDTIPEHIDYRIMTACNKVEYTLGLNVYLDDTLDDILSMVKQGKFDKALDAVYTQYFNAYATNPLIMRANKIDGKSLHGRCKTLRVLLEENNFMYDFATAFNIFPLGFELEFTGADNSKLTPLCAQALSHVCRVNIKDTFVIEYGRDIDRSKIEMSYLMAKTPSNKIYIIAYTSEGEYVESKEAMEKVMSQMHGVALAGNTDKYDK